MKKWLGQCVTTEPLPTELSEEHAMRIKAIFYYRHLPEWLELARCFPKFSEAIAMLPDLSGIKTQNVIMQEMFVDAYKWSNQ